MAIWRIRIACWIPKATNTHSGFVKLNAFPLQQWLHERTSVLRYTYISRLVCICLIPKSITLNHLTPNDHFSGLTAPLTSRCCIFYLFNKYTY